MSDHDSAETESSICEEERLRRLFYLCDENGDGYIDRYVFRTSLFYFQMSAQMYQEVFMFLVPMSLRFLRIREYFTDSVITNNEVDCLVGSS